MSYLTVRTIAYDSIGNASQPSPVSSTVYFVPVIAWTYSVPDDFDGDSIPDVLTHDAVSGVVELELSSDGAQEQIDTPTEMRGGWEIVAQGDYDSPYFVAIRCGQNRSRRQCDDRLAGVPMPVVFDPG